MGTEGSGGSVGGSAPNPSVNTNSGVLAFTNATLFSSGASNVGGTVSIPGLNGSATFSSQPFAALPTVILTGPPTTVVEGDAADAQLRLTGNLIPGDVYHFTVNSSNGTAMAGKDYQAIPNQEEVLSQANNWTVDIPITTIANPADPYSVDFTLSATQDPGDFLRLLTGLADTDISETGNAATSPNVVTPGQPLTILAGDILNNIFVDQGATLNIYGTAIGVNGHGDIVNVFAGGHIINDFMQDGALTIAGGSAELGAGTNTGTITFQGGGGELTLDQPIGFTGAIDFASNPVGDIIDLANTGVAGVQVNGSSLVITQTDGQVLTYQLGNFGSNTFTVQSDGAGGSDLVVKPLVTAMITRDGNNGDYEIYSIGNNTILTAAALGQVGVDWTVAGLGSFSGNAGESDDMLLRNGNTGQFEVYDISNNAITSAAGMGQVGMEWAVAGFGDFSGTANETDMLMRNRNTGVFELYDISNNAIKSAAPMGQVGLEWTVAGFGDFSGHANEADMLMRNSTTGAFEVYDIGNNQITSAAGMGQVGLEWTVAGFGDFSGHANETDMLMRNSNTGAFEVYDIDNNTITSAAGMGQVGLEWTVAGFGDFSGHANETDMLMRNSNTGAFEVYDIGNNTITLATGMGQVGLEWSVAGVAADPPSSSAPAASTQLVQAMASYAPSASAVAPSSTLDQTSPIAATPFAAPGGQIRQT
jgi:hypothetical protein